VHQATSALLAAILCAVAAPAKQAAAPGTPLPALGGSDTASWSYANGVVESLQQSAWLRPNGSIAIQQIFTRTNAQVPRDTWVILYPPGDLDQAEVLARTNTTPVSYDVRVTCKLQESCITASVNGEIRHEQSDSLHFTTREKAEAAAGVLRDFIARSAPASSAPSRPGQDQTAAKRSDADLFTEARVAIDKFKDCKAALQALHEVSAAGRKDPIWIFYSAKAAECAGELRESLGLYRDYNALVPGQQAVLDKIGEIEYRLRKQTDEERATREKQQEEARETARKQTAADAALNAFLEKIAGTWHQTGDTAPVYYNQYCSAKRHEERTLRVDRFSAGAVQTMGTYRIRLTITADRDNPSDCEKWDGVDMTRGTWDQSREYSAEVVCSKDDSATCRIQMRLSSCSGDSCGRAERSYSVTVRPVGRQLEFDSPSDTLLFSRY
jgi:hypothetical protein